MNGHGWSSTSTLTGERQLSVPGLRGTFYAKAMRREPKAFVVSYKAPGEHEVSLGTVWGIDGASRIARAHADRLRGSRRATKGEPKTSYGGGYMASDESPRRERIEESRRFEGDVSDRLIAARVRHGKTEPGKVKNLMRGYLKGPLRGLRNPIAAGLRAWNPRTGVAGRRASSTAVAETILRQLGGARRLTAMIGAKNFIAYESKSSPYGEGLGGVSFRFMDPGAGKPNYIKIILDPSDTYTVAFGRVRGMNFKVLKTFSDIYADSLVGLIQRETGLALHL